MNDIDIFENYQLVPFIYHTGVHPHPDTQLWYHKNGMSNMGMITEGNGPISIYLNDYNILRMSELNQNCFSLYGDWWKLAKWAAGVFPKDLSCHVEIHTNQIQVWTQLQIQLIKQLRSHQETIFVTSTGLKVHS